MVENSGNETIRNISINFAFKKPNFYKKSICSAVLTLLTMCLLNCFFMFNKSYKLIVFIVLILIGLWFYSICFNVLYRRYLEIKNINDNYVAVIGFSNKFLILGGDELELITEIQADEIEIRKLTIDERQEYFSNTSVICIKIKGEEKKKYYLQGVREYEGYILKPNPDRANEDLEIFYYDFES